MPETAAEAQKDNGRAGQSTGPRATCKCGHDYEHYMVSPQGDYSFWGWVLVWTGVSAIPKKVSFTCRDCGETFAETTDPTLCKRYR